MAVKREQRGRALHELYRKADALSSEVIGGAIEVHREKGPGLLEEIYERCLARELELRSIAFETQVVVPVEYKGIHRLILPGANIEDTEL